MIPYVAYALLGYLMGSVMFSYLLPKLLTGKDVRVLSGDGNPGSANAIQKAGLPVGLLCLFCDVAKGILPGSLAVGQLEPSRPLFGLGLAAPVLGHAFPPMLHGRGGKSIAVSFGVLIGLLPLRADLAVCLAALFLFFSLVVVISPHALRAIVVFLLLSGYCIFRVRLPSFAIGSVIIAATVAYRHIAAGSCVRPSVALLPMLFHRKTS